jgi:sortase A
MTRHDQQVHKSGSPRHLQPAPAQVERGGASDRRRVSRRAFLSLALAGLLVAACKREQIVYVEAPRPTPDVPSLAPTLAPTVAPTAQPTAAPKPEARPTQGVIPLPIPAGGPVAAMTAQSEIIPPLHFHDHPYTNRLQPPDRLQIPSIGLDTKVVPIGNKTDAQGHFLWETAAFAVGYHKGTALPGDVGNVVLSGHISSPHEGNVFTGLPKVAPGDGIVVSTAERQFLYVVTETKVVTPDAVEVLDPTDEAIVTMLTCVPDGIYSHRLVVRAEAVS